MVPKQNDIHSDMLHAMTCDNIPFKPFFIAIIANQFFFGNLVAPDENPQELVWIEGRAKTTHNRFIDNINEATDEFIRYLREIHFDYKFL